MYSLLSMGRLWKNMEVDAMIKVWTQMFMQRVAPPQSETAANVTNWTPG